MKEKFFILMPLQSSSLEQAGVRSILHEHSLVYIEIENTFLVSCSKAQCKPISEQFASVGIKYILIYVNNKVGATAFAHGINDRVYKRILEIIEHPKKT